MLLVRKHSVGGKCGEWRFAVPRPEVVSSVASASLSFLIPFTVEHNDLLQTSSLTHPSIPTSKSSGNFLITHQLRRLGKQVSLLKAFRTPCSSINHIPQSPAYFWNKIPTAFSHGQYLLWIPQTFSL